MGMPTVAHVLAPLGRKTEVARKLGVGPSAVSHWIRENSIPARRVLELEALAAREDISLDLTALRLLGMNRSATEQRAA